MAVTTEDSVEIGNVEANPPVLLATHQLSGRIRYAFFDFTQGATLGDAGSIARLVKLPAGKVRVILPLSFVGVSALGTSRTMDLGWEAYTDDSGVAIAADPNGLDDGQTVATAIGYVPTGTIQLHETKLFEARTQAVLTAQVNDGDIPAGATIKGHFAYVVD